MGTAQALGEVALKVLAGRVTGHGGRQGGLEDRRLEDSIPKKAALSGPVNLSVVICISASDTACVEGTVLALAVSKKVS
jgi:hypothetical protein